MKRPFHFVGDLIKNDKGAILLEKFLITNNNYSAILANPARLREHKITKIYLRDRNLSPTIFRAFLELKNVEIFVNYTESPELLSYKNIHLKGNELHLAGRFKGIKVLSYSAHSLEDIIRAHESKIDYIFISPIFAVEGKNAPLGLEILAQIPEVIKPKIFALGGINERNIYLFENLGIRGVAGIRAFGKIFE